MITITKQENGVLFTFTNSDKYLYGSGTIEVPFNSLSIIQDESDNITLRKSASNDIFLSARYDTDFGYASKEEAVNALKEILYDEAGISEEEVQQMIDAATSGIPSSEVIEQLRRDVNAVSGEVDTKQDILTAGENITISGNVISAEAGNNIIELTQAEYDALTEKDPDALYIITDAQEINMNNYATKNDLAAKADASALTAVSDAVSGKADTTYVNQIASQATQAITAISGQVQTKADASDLNALSGDVQTKMATYDAALRDKVDTTTYESGQYATAQALNALQENKLDASAYTPTDLSQYWTSGQTQEAINAATSGIPSSQVIEQLRTDVNTLSGAVADKQDALSAGTGIEISGNVISATGGGALFVDSELDETSNNPVANSAITTAIIDNEEVISRAINDLNDRIGDPYQKVSGLTIEYNSDDQMPQVIMELEDEELGSVSNIFNKWGVDVSTNDEETGHITDAYINYDGSMGVYEQTEGQEGDEDEGMTYEKSIDLYTDRLELNDSTNGDGYHKNETVMITKDAITMNKTVNNEGVESQLSSIEIKNDDGTSIHFTDGSDELDLNNQFFDWTDGTDSRSVRWNDIASLNDIDNAGAYYISFATLATQGISDDDWDGIVAAIDDHRPIYAGYPRQDGGIIYYGVECMNKNSGNTEIKMTASDNSAHYFYTFTKNGSNDYTFTSETKPYVTDAEKTAWNAKQDALSAGTGISISNNVISTSGVVMSQNVTQLVKLTQAAYDALATKDSSTLYIISD